MTIRLLVLAGCTLSCVAAAQPRGDALLAIDQSRPTVIDRIMRVTGEAVVRTGTADAAQLRDILSRLRADHLLAASLAGSGEGLRDVVAGALARSDSAAPGAQAKAFGDAGDDLVYTPVTPCRLVETRGSFAAVYQGDGTAAHHAVPFGPNEVRTYAVHGGNGACVSQLPASLHPAAIQIQVFGMPNTAASGDIEILPQGAAFGATATMVYVGSIAFNTVSTNARVNLANNQISVQVRGGGAHLAIDVVGYFKLAANFDAANVVTGVYAFAAGSQNEAIGDYSTVAGGNFNGAGVPDGTSRVLGKYAAIAGGHDNIAEGESSFIAGGAFNYADEKGSFAAGTMATSRWPGQFTLADSTQAQFDAGVLNASGLYWANPTNTFNARASGGVMFVTGVTAAGDPQTGVSIGPGSGTWVSHSDRNAKENFAAVDARDILDKVVALPITRWNYITEGPQTRHLGPVAQDFHAAFGVGADDHGIAVVDADGVALAAIQGLNAKLEHQIAQQQRELDLLRGRLARIEKRSRR